MAGGKITRIVGGRFETRCKNLTYYQDSFTITSGGKTNLTTDAEMIFGMPEAPPGNKYILSASWDKKSIYLGEKAELTLTTSITETGHKLKVQLYHGNTKIANEIELTIKDKKAVLTLTMSGVLQYRKMIANSKNKYLEIYAEVTYSHGVYYQPRGTTKTNFRYERVNLPASSNNYLKVRKPNYPDLLFVQPARNYYFPEIRTEEGNLVYMQIIEDFRGTLAQETSTKIAERITKWTERKSFTLALREIATGNLIRTDGKKIKLNEFIEEYVESIDSKYSGYIKRARNTSVKNTVYINNKKTSATTTGLNQLEVISSSNPLRTAANFGSKLLQILDFNMNIATWASEVNRKKLPSGAGGVVLNFFPSYFATYLALSIVVDFMVNEAVESYQTIEENAFWEVFYDAKNQGMSAMKSLIENRKGFARERGFEFYQITTSILIQLVSKQIKTFNEFIKKDGDEKLKNPEHGVVIRRIFNNEYQQDIFYIYCIFINNNVLN